MLKLLKKFNQGALKYGTAALLIALPLYPKFPILKVPGIFVAIRLEDFLILAVFIIWLLHGWPDLKKLLQNKITQAILIFLGVALVSVIVAIFLSQTVTPHLALLHWARRVEYLSLFFVGLAAARRENNFQFFLKCQVLVIFILFLYGLGQKYFYWPIVTTQNVEYSKGIALRYVPGGHLPSTFAGHYDLATYLVLILPILFAWFFVSVQDRKTDLLLKLIFLLAIGSSFWLLVNSVSRISILAYLIGSSLALFLLRKYKMIFVVLLASLLLAGFSPSLISRYTRVIQVTIQKMILEIKPSIVKAAASPSLPERRTLEVMLEPTPTPIPIFEDRSVSIRLNIEWPRALRAFYKNPLLGTGFSSITLATDNDYLRLLGEAGAMGFLAFGLLVLRLLTSLLKSFPLPKKIDYRLAFKAGILGGLIGVLINAVFIDVFEASKFATIFWLLMGFANVREKI